jgi:hypothetical protein
MRAIARACLLLLPLGLLAACNPPAAPAKPPKAVNPGPPLTPNPMPPGYIGVWAAGADQCPTLPWTVSDKGLTAAGKVSCAFNQVTPNETGWIAEGACTVDAASAPASLVLNTTRTGAVRTLAISGGPFKTPLVLQGCEAPIGIPPSGTAASAEPGPAAAEPGNAALAQGH